MNNNPKDYRKINGNNNPEEVELEIENLELEDTNFKTSFNADVNVETTKPDSGSEGVENLDMDDISDASSAADNSIESSSSDNGMEPSDSTSSEGLDNKQNDLPNSPENENDSSKKDEGNSEEQSGEDKENKEESSDEDKEKESTDDKSESKEEGSDDNKSESEENAEGSKDDSASTTDTSDDTKDDKGSDSDKEDKSDSNESKEEPSQGKDLKDKDESSSDKKEDSGDKSSSDSDEKKSIKDRASEKADELKDKAQDKWDNSAAKEKLDKAKEFAKDPKGSIKNAAKDRFNNSRVGQGINKAKNFKKNPKDALRNAAKDKFNNSKAGQALQKGKDAADKAKKTVDKTKKAAKTAKKTAKAAGKAAKGLWHLIVSTSPWSWIVIGAIALLFILIVLIMGIAGMDGKSDVNDSREEQNYSEKDMKTLEKLRKIYTKYSNGDAPLAMVTVVYPYYETLIDPSVLSDLKDYDPKKFEDYQKDYDPKKFEDYQDEGDAATVDDDDEDSSEDCKDDECDKELEDDMYLTLYRKSYYRNQFKKLLKKSNKSDGDAFDAYIKDKYMEQAKGYKNLLKGLSGDEREAVKEKILDNLKEHSEYFKSYIYENLICSTSSTSLGYSDATQGIDGPIYIVLKDTRSGNFSSIKNAPSLYGTENLNLDLKRYVMGVVYAELGDVSLEQYVKTFMISAKSLVLGRTASGGTALSGMGYKYENTDGKTVFYMRGNDSDQDFCDIYDGCQSGTYSKYTMKNSAVKNLKGPLSEVDQVNMSRWYDEVANEFVYDNEGKGFHANYCTDYGACKYCKVGNCISQNKAKELAATGKDYNYILYTASYSSRYSKYDIETQTLSAVSVSCTGISSGGCTIPDDKFIYYSQRSYSNTFCGRTDGSTISGSGCGVTSMAMILANLVDPSHTPLTTMPEAQAGNYCGDDIVGTNSAFFKVEAAKYGLTYSQVSAGGGEEAKKKIKETLRSGGLIIANVGAGWKTVSDGHYTIIKGITADEKLIIADPMDYKTNTSNVPESVPNYLSIEEMEGYMKGRVFHLFTGGKSSEIKETYCKSGGHGYLTNPLDPNNTTKNFMEIRSAQCYPRYIGTGSCNGDPHTGVDIGSANGASDGAAVYAMDSGKVIFAGTYSGNCYGQPGCSGSNKSYGLGVEIDHGNGYTTIYGHLSKRIVNTGDEVEQGQLIGYVGNTGNSSAPHLHLSLKNKELLSKYLYSEAKGHDDRGYMNACKYINSTESYVGKTK